MNWSGAPNSNAFGAILTARATNAIMATLRAPAMAMDADEERDTSHRDNAQPPTDVVDLEDFSMSSEDEQDDGEIKLDHAMMNELLLVCSNLGMLRVVKEGEAPTLMRGEDCEEWVHDLQRAIRRDHAKHKLVAKQLGKWRILQKKLLPLLINHQHDWSLCFSILKVLVMLTMKPTPDSTNIAQQYRYLRDYKQAVLHQQLLPILMTILVDPLSRKGAQRTSQDYLVMELVLTLLRNLLAIPNEDSRFVTSATAYLSHLQQDFVQALHEESVFEMILLFTQDIDSAENREWNLLIMEMIDLTLACSQPKSVGAFLKNQMAKARAPTTNTAATSSTPGTRTAPSMRQPTAANSLTMQLNKEKSALARPTSRHSNFGGLISVTGPTGRSTILTNVAKTGDAQIPQVSKKPTSRRRGSRQRNHKPDAIELQFPKSTVSETDEATMTVLLEICDAILSKSYFQFTNSLKTEFRRGSSKLVPSDRLQYFHLVWFLTAYHRTKGQMLKSQYRQAVKAYEKKKLDPFATEDAGPPPDKPVFDEKAVLSTLDMFSFNFVLQSIENYATEKNYRGMTVGVKLLAEMMAYLSELIGSDDPRLARIGDSIQHKVFYERDFLDRLPVLIKSWSPEQFGVDYVIDVVTLTHLILKVLDRQGSIKVLTKRKTNLQRKQKKKSSGENGEDGSSSESSDEEESERQAQLLLEMQRKEAELDVRKYFTNILSHDTIKMYCYLLTSYRDNGAKVNHFVHSFFYRVKHFEVHKGEKWTTQPILFNIHVMQLFNTLLQDPQIQRNPEFKPLLDFIKGVVREFFALADKNHMLFVESIIRQSFITKSCVLMQRNYEHFDTHTKSRAEAVALGREKQIDLINQVRQQRRALDAEELEGEAEFTFDVQPADFQASSLVNKEKEKGDSGSEDEGSEKDDGGSDEGLSKRTKKKRTRKATDRAKRWTLEEDRNLKTVYLKYRHLPSVYEVISYEDMFQDNNRTPEQIERRVKFLKLHRITAVSDDEQDNADEAASSASDADPLDELMQEKKQAEDDNDEGSSRTKRASRLRRLRRSAAEDDGSDSDEDMFASLERNQGATDADGDSADVEMRETESPKEPADDAVNEEVEELMEESTEEPLKKPTQLVEDAEEDEVEELTQTATEVSTEMTTMGEPSSPANPTTNSVTKEPTSGADGDTAEFNEDTTMQGTLDLEAYAARSSEGVSDARSPAEETAATSVSENTSESPRDIADKASAEAIHQHDSVSEPTADSKSETLDAEKERAELIGKRNRSYSGDQDQSETTKRQRAQSDLE
ncbi:TPA: hypothetical protein N0F65_004461 [Lagenidium giganteum]|uniref:Timeless N-terminal domain-containing protein n=1 Tax=Lagenidium giganteum TaxID=4803 RepID=A0AAV2ZGI8_9STRA|nr:TPA: hypothetical protein N0F65_004461 [Lagenidium giganteum]